MILMACILVIVAQISAATTPVGLNVPEKKEIAMQLVSAAENSSLDWKKQYGYIEYNVEGNDTDNRGYTGGLIGFTSKTGDMLAVVRRFDRLQPHNVLSSFLPALERVNNSSSRAGLGDAFISAWKSAAHDAKFKHAQNAERDETYFDPAVEQAQLDGLRELGQFIYYDAIVMHGPGNDADSFGGIRASAISRATPPSLGGDEATYLAAFLAARIAAMKREKSHEDTSRIDTMQRVFLEQKNFTLQPPLRFSVYGDHYEISPTTKPSQN